jgi:hypothetical protein
VKKFAFFQPEKYDFLYKVFCEKNGAQDVRHNDLCATTCMKWSNHVVVLISYKVVVSTSVCMKFIMESIFWLEPGSRHIYIYTKEFLYM